LKGGREERERRSDSGCLLPPLPPPSPTGSPIESPECKFVFKTRIEEEQKQPEISNSYLLAGRGASLIFVGC